MKCQIRFSIYALYHVCIRWNGILYLPCSRTVHLANHPDPVVADQLDLVLRGQTELARVEDGVLVRVQHHLRRPVLQHRLPLAQVQKSIAEHDPRLDPVFLNELRRLDGPVQDVRDRQGEHLRLVGKAVDGDDVLVPRLGEELGQLIVDLEGPLPVQVAVCPVQPPDGTLMAAVVPPVLAARNAVQVQVHPEAIFSAIFNRPEKVSPSDLGHVWVAFIGLDSPVRILDPDMVEARISDVCKVLLGDERRVMLLDRPGR